MVFANDFMEIIIGDIRNWSEYSGREWEEAAAENWRAPSCGGCATPQQKCFTVKILILSCTCM